MPNLIAWLLAAAWPIAKKILVSLGIGWATYEGLSIVANQIKLEVIASWGQMGAATLQILTLGGVTQAVGILLSALMALATLLASAKLTKVVS